MHVCTDYCLLNTFNSSIMFVTSSCKYNGWSVFKSNPSVFINFIVLKEGRACWIVFHLFASNYVP